MVTRNRIDFKDVAAVAVQEESWRRMPVMSFCYQQCRAQPIVSGKTLVTYNGHVKETIVGLQSVEYVHSSVWPGEFLYHEISQFPYTMTVTLTSGTYHWQDSSDVGCAARYLLVVEAGQYCVLHETMQLQDSARNLDIVVKKGASLQHYAALKPAGQMCDHIQVWVEEGASYQQFFAISGQDVYRRSQCFHALASDSQVMVQGMVAVKSKGFVSDHTLLKQHAANTRSIHRVNTILDQGAKADVYSTVDVVPKAPKVTTRQNIRHLLLSEDAKAFSKPALNISVDDVDCQHGAVSRMIDDDLLFYMNSRGLDRQQATQLYLEGYVDTCFKGYPEGDRLALQIKKAIGLLDE